MAIKSGIGKPRPDSKVQVTDRWGEDHVDVYEMTLEEYYANVLWGAKKRRYAEAFPEAGCFICGRRDYQLHHLRYDNLGQEEWDELLPLCPDHHYEIEKHIGKGYPGVTRENAHLDFVRQKPRSAGLTLQRV
jgi:hypothetical protein